MGCFKSRPAQPDTIDLRLVDGNCKHCGFNGRIVTVRIPQSKDEEVKRFRIWQKGSHKGIEVMTIGSNQYFIEKCGGLTMVSQPRLVDSYGEWMDAKARRTVKELEAAPFAKSHTIEKDSCADVVDLLWGQLMHQNTW